MSKPELGIKRRKTYARSEEERLKREIARYEQRLAVLHAQRAGEPEQRAADAAAGRRRYRLRSYAAYVYDLIRSTMAYGLWERSLMIFRRFRLVSTVIRITTTIFAILQTGAVFIVIGGILLTALPIFAVFSLLALMRSALTLHRRGRRLADLIRGRPLIIFFFPRSAGRCVSIAETAGELASRGDAVILVSPPKTLRSREYRIDGVYRVSRFDYFYFNSHFFCRSAERTDVFL